MMKKLMVLCVVLALAGAVQAGVYFEGPATFTLGETITINVVADEAASGLSIGAINVVGGSIVSTGTVNAQLQNGSWGGGDVRDGSVENIYIFQQNGAIAAGASEVAAGTVLYSFDVVTDGIAELVTIDDWQGINPFGGPGFPISTKFNASETNMEALSIPTPEPMTLGLLGLGGLFLRRRKK